MENTKKKDTRKRIETAIKQIQNLIRKGDSKLNLNISSVAKQAGVSRATIHNRYPDLADEIKNLNGTGVSDRLKSAKSEISRLKKLNRKLRDENKRLENRIADIASVNATLTLKLKMVGSGNKNIVQI